MLLFKSCPKCHGDLHVNSDIYGDYKECLQCGMIVDIESMNKRLAVSFKAEKKRRRVARVA